MAGMAGSMRTVRRQKKIGPFVDSVSPALAAIDWDRVRTVCDGVFRLGMIAAVDIRMIVEVAIAEDR